MNGKKIAAIASIGLLVGACADDNADDRELAQTTDPLSQYDRQPQSDPNTTPPVQPQVPSYADSTRDQTMSPKDPNDTSRDPNDTSSQMSSYGESIADAKVGDIVGKELVNANGEELGDVDKVVVNRNTNEKMVVIGLKGIVGDGAKEVAIPIDQIKMSPDGDKIETNLSKQDLEVQPDVDPGDYTELDTDG